MKYRVNPELSTRKIDSEVFIYDRNKSLIHTFNETGTILWGYLAEGVRTQDMVKYLTNEFDVDQSTAASDVESFFATLISLCIVTIDL